MLFPKTNKPFIILSYTKYRTAANDSEQLWNNKKLGDSKRHSLFAKGVPIQLSTHKTPECTWTHTNKPHLQNPSEKKCVLRSTRDRPNDETIERVHNTHKALRLLLSGICRKTLWDQMTNSKVKVTKSVDDTLSP